MFSNNHESLKEEAPRVKKLLNFASIVCFYLFTAGHPLGIKYASSSQQTHNNIKSTGHHRVTIKYFSVLRGNYA